MDVASLVPHRHDPSRQEMLLWFAGQAADASPLLLGILGRGDSRPQRRRPHRGPLAVDDDILHQDLLLAARCLGMAPRLRVGWLRPAIVEATHDLLHSSGSYPIRKAAAQVLAGAGDRALRDRLIDDLTDASIAQLTRTHIVEALGDTEDGHVAARLTHLLGTLDPHDHLVSDVAIALRVLRYAPALPTLRTLLDRGRGSGRCDVFVAGAVAALGGAEGAADVCRLAETTDGFGWKAAWALKFSADPSVREWLIASVPGASDDDVFTSVESYLALQGASGAARVLAALLTRSSWGRYFDDVASRFSGYTSPDLATPLLEALTDAKREPAVRWAVSTILDDIPEAWPALHDLITRRGADRITVQAGAAVLGRQGHRTALHPLRDALTRLIIQRGQTARRFALPRVAQALATLEDDEWVQDTLLPHIDRALAPERPHLGHATVPMLVALGRTDVRRIPGRVTHIVERILETNWFAFTDEPELAALVLPSAVPHLLDLVGSGRVGASAANAALRLVAKAARDLSTVPRLLPLLSASDEQAREAARDALATLGRQHQVRIFADGRIIPTAGSGR